MVANDSHALLLDVLPENRDFIFIPPNGDNRHKLMRNWPTNKVSLDFIDKLKDMQKALSKLEPDSIIEAGFLANPKTMEAFRLRCKDVPAGDSGMYSDLIADFKLLTYDNLGSGLISLFSKKAKIGHGEITERVKEIIVEHLGVDASKVQEDMYFVDDLGADEYDFLELAMAFEKEFGCHFPADTYERILTVKDAIDFINNHHT